MEDGIQADFPSSKPAPQLAPSHSRVPSPLSIAFGRTAGNLQRSSAWIVIAIMTESRKNDRSSRWKRGRMFRIPGIFAPVNTPRFGVRMWNFECEWNYNVFTSAAEICPFRD